MAAVADGADISKKQAKAAIETLLQIAYAGAKDKQGFMVPGLGKLIKVNRKARMGRNPATGEAIKIPAKTVVKFRLAKAAKEAVLG
jgi:DNA-binding protein HU-beta